MQSHTLCIVQRKYIMTSCLQHLKCLCDILVHQHDMALSLSYWGRKCGVWSFTVLLTIHVRILDLLHLLPQHWRVFWTCGKQHRWQKSVLVYMLDSYGKVQIIRLCLLHYTLSRWFIHTFHIVVSRIKRSNLILGTRKIPAAVNIRAPNPSFLGSNESPPPPSLPWSQVLSVMAATPPQDRKSMLKEMVNTACTVHPLSVHIINMPHMFKSCRTQSSLNYLRMRTADAACCLHRRGSLVSLYMFRYELNWLVFQLVPREGA